MGYLNLNNKKKIFLVLYISLLIFSSLGARTTFYKSESNDFLTFNDEMEFTLNDVQFDLESLPKWKEQISKADQNENGIDDNFEVRLKELSEFGFIEENSDRNKDSLDWNYNYDDNFKTDYQKTDKITVDDIPIIIFFPSGIYDSISLLFETLGGKIKSTYKAALNGFGGRINYNSLNDFYGLLIQNDIPFFIEEDMVFEAQLYYAGRNMNLRPYVWNTLSYDGDEYSSIAILDSGIDDSHSFFTPGYSDADFNYKIVGWRDEVNGLPSPYDDNGHGSHCSGISAGEGGPNYDGTGRTVATAANEWDDLLVPSGYYPIKDFATFNVTDPGLIEVFCEFDDFTPGPDDVNFRALLYYGYTMVDSYVVTSDSWSHTLSHTATSSSLGLYCLRFSRNFIDNTGDGYVSDSNYRFRSEMHWPFSPNLFGSGNAWKGVAPDTHLVGVKVMDQHGQVSITDAIDGIEWVVTNKNVYNITTMSLSFGSTSSDFGLINAVNKAVEEGIVTVVAAGNYGLIGFGLDMIGSPGDADNVITVAATNIYDEITSYSSQGGPSYTGNTLKPDIAAPGGSFHNLEIFSADSNDNDAEGGYPTDGYANDMMGTHGTSMSAPAVAGAANLLIEAMGGHPSWGYTGTEAKRVKALLLMSATETVGREIGYQPQLNRGGKDVHEGYGRLNVDIAIEAYTQELALGSTQNAWIASSFDNPFTKHGFGCYVNLNEGQIYNFTLDVPFGADFDLHLYSNNPSSIGEPIMVASSTSSGLGTDEIIFYTATETGKYYLVAKAISGKGNAIILCPIIAHDLSVSFEVPTFHEINNTYTINATVANTGINNEINVDLFLYLDDALVDSITIPSLLVGASEAINYMWTPIELDFYNFTAYAPPVPDEPYIENNIATELILFSEVKVFDGMFISYNFTFNNDVISSDFIYSLVSREIFHVNWYTIADHMYWDVNTQTRIMENSGGRFSFGNGVHTPAWIFTNVSLGDEIFIAVIAEGNHIFNVSNELIYDLPGFGLIDVWVLEDLTLPGGVAWYEKSTGILLNGTFYNSGGGIWYTFNFVDTNAISIDHDLGISLEVPTLPKINNPYIINATVVNTGINNKTNVDLFLYLDDALVDSITIPSLPVGAIETINYMWTPTEHKTYNFTAYAPPVPGETHIGDNIATELISVIETKLFNGMYIDHIYTSSDGSDKSSRFSYSYYSGSLFFETWNISLSLTWYVDSQTRLTSGGSQFGDGVHTLAWIFTNVSLGDTVLIVDPGEGDHLFNISNELIYDLPGFGLIDVWELEDLTVPGGVAWYEKSTGILLGGIFYDTGGGSWCTFDFVDTNVEFTYAVPPGDFILSSNAGTPDDDGNFNLMWESADGALTYSLYEYSSYITEINGSLTLLGAGITDLSLVLSGYTDGTYYFIVVAHNAYVDTLSNCIEVVVSIPPGNFILSSNAGTPDDNGAFDLSWTSAVGAVSYSVYDYLSYITEITGSLTLLGDGITDLSLALSGYTDGTYYFIVVAHSANGDTLSNCIEIVVQIPGIPGYDIYLVSFTIFLISGVISVMTLRKKRKN